MGIIIVSITLLMRCDHRGVQWVHPHPQGGERNSRRNLQRKFVSASQAQAEQESILRTFFLLGGVDVEGRCGLFSSFSAVLACVLSATTKKTVWDHSLIMSRFFSALLPPPSLPVTKCHTKLPPNNYVTPVQPPPLQRSLVS